jgi:hypothetical protein
MNVETCFSRWVKYPKPIWWGIGEESDTFEWLNRVKTIWQNRIGWRDVWLSPCLTSTKLTVIMWWAWTHVCHQGSKHGWFVWMVGSTDAGHWIVDAPMKNNAEDTMKASFFFCGLKIITYDFNIYISYCSFSNTNIFCMM